MAKEVKNDDCGLKIVRRVEDTSIDIIAVPGIGAHPDRTWTMKNSDGKWVNWLVDAAMLPRELPNARIMRFGYRSEWSGPKEVETKKTQDPTRPLLFVAHSFGGHVVMYALRRSFDNPSRWSTTFASTAGLVFLGTPFRGRYGMSLSDMVTTIIEDNPEYQIWPETMEISVPETPFLAETVKRFQETRVKNHAIPIECFYETLPSPIGKVLQCKDPVKAGKKVYVVPEESACLDISDGIERHPLDRNHYNLNKFCEASDQNYKSVKDGIVKMAKGAIDFLNHCSQPAPKNLQDKFQSLDPTGSPSQSMEPIEPIVPEHLTRWLAPTTYECYHYEQDLEDARSTRHPGTCQWIEPRPLFKTWKSSKLGSESALLWIHAIPGAGKTVLASYLIDLARNTKGVNLDRHSVLYFFCKNADIDKNSPVAVARALVYQLLQSLGLNKRQEIIRDLQLLKATGGQPRAVSFRSLWNFFCKQCQNLPHATIILDAADECSDPHFLIPGLLNLARQGAARIVVTSRREPELVDAFKTVPSLCIGADDLRADIKVYLEYQVSKSAILSDLRVRSRIVRILNIRSKGMFLWVALMLKELESRSTIDEIESALASLPDGLSEVYEQILVRLHRTLKPSRRVFCCRLLRWITLAMRPLRLDEIGEALKLEYGTITSDSGFTPNLLCSVRDLELACGSLVTVQNQFIQLIHLSAREFLMSPSKSSPLGQRLETFLIDQSEDSALIASICVACLSSCCAARMFSEDHSTERSLWMGAPLLDYASLFWASHLIQSRHHAVVQHGSKLQPFLESRKSFYWLEFCFTFRRDIGQLDMLLQSLLDWLGSTALKDTQAEAQPKLLSLLEYWIRSHLRLLADYGPALKKRPYEIHNIDPKRIFLPSHHRILESLGCDTSYDRHLILEDSRSSSIATQEAPVYRCLQKHTSPDDQYAFFLYDKRRGAFFLIDKDVGNTPRIFCQELATGRRLPPIIDTEFGEESDSLTTKGASMSPDGRFLAILYVWMDKHSHSPFEEAWYTAIWLLPELLDFVDSGPLLWARKVLSTSNKGATGGSSPQPIVFKNDGLVVRTFGCIDLTSGVEDDLYGRSELADPWDITFSGDGQTAVRFIDHARRLDYVIPGGKSEIIYQYQSNTVLVLGALSQTGRFLTWSESTYGEERIDDRLRIYDRQSSKINELDKPPCLWFSASFLFTRDGKALLATIKAADQLNRSITQIVIWKWHDSEFRLWASRVIQGHLTGFCIDEEDHHLYIISKERVWSRLDLASTKLQDLDSETFGDEYIRVEHQISQDGNRMAILRQTSIKNEVQIVSLRDFSTIYQGQLNLPEPDAQCDGRQPLVRFSPNLDLIFVGNVLLEVRVPESKPLLLPLPKTLSSGLHRHKEGLWACQFSACSQYIAITRNPELNRQCLGELLVFEIDMKRKIWFPRFEDACVAQYNRLMLDFHPRRPELVINGWIEGVPDSGSIAPYKCDAYTIMAVTSLLLDLTNGRLVDLGEPIISHRNDDNDPCQLSSELAIRYSACATYILLASAYGPVLSWPIPGRTKPSTPTLPYVLGPTRSCPVDPLCLTDLDSAMRPYILDPLPKPPMYFHATGRADERLTVVPVHWNEGMVSFLLDDGLDSRVRVLYSGVDGAFELKFLGFTMREYAAKFWKWHDELVERENEWWKKEEASNYYSEEEELSD